MEVKDCFETVYELEEKHTLNDLYTPDVVVMANRRKWERLLKSVQVPPKLIDRWKYGFSTGEK